MSEKTPPCGHGIAHYDITWHSREYQQLECMVCDWVIREGPGPVAYSGPARLDPWRRPTGNGDADARA